MFPYIKANWTAWALVVVALGDWIYPFKDWRARYLMIVDVKWNGVQTLKNLSYTAVIVIIIIIVSLGFLKIKIFKAMDQPHHVTKFL